LKSGKCRCVGSEVTMFLTSNEPIDKRLMRSISKDDFAEPRIRDPVDATRRLEEHSSILVNRMTCEFLSYLHSDIFSPFLSSVCADNDAANLLVNPRTKRRIPVVSFRILNSFFDVRRYVLSLECYHEFRKSPINFTSAKLFYYTQTP